MAKRGRKAKPKQQAPIQVPHEAHLDALVIAHRKAKADAVKCMTDVKAKVKVAKKAGGLDPLVWSLRLKLDGLSFEAAKRKAELIVLALHRGGFLTGDLITVFPTEAIEQWAREVEGQYRRTDEAGTTTVPVDDKPVFDETAAAKAGPVDATSPEEAERIRAEVESAMGGKAPVMTDEEFKRKVQEHTAAEIAEEDAREARPRPRRKLSEGSFAQTMREQNAAAEAHLKAQRELTH
jgi:hypothetical protein